MKRVDEHDDGLSLGELIRKQREFAELPMRQLADMVGISIPYLSQIERDLREPSEKVLDGIARSLQTSADELSAAAASAQPDNTVAFEEAIRGDPDLTARQRQALLEVYTAMTASTTAHRSARRRRPAGAGG